MRERVLSNAPVAAGATQTIKVTGVGAVPAGGVSMVAINVVAKGASAAGGLIVYPSDLSSPPAVTGSRYYARTSTDHVLMVKVGADGQVKLKNTGSTTANVYVDIHGYVTGAATATGAGYVPLDTSRIASNLNVAPNSSASFSAVGAGAVPAAGVSHVAMTLTVRSVGSGQAIVHPSGTAVPTGSDINYRPSDFMSNLAIVAPGEDGKITITNRGASNLRVYVDVAGYFAAPEADVVASSQVPVNPARIVNEVTVASGATYEVAPLGKAGVPASGVSGVGVNLTSRASAVGLLRIYPTGQTSIPSGGSVAYQAGVYWADFVPVKLGSDGTFTVKNMGSAAVTLSVDTFAYFKPPSRPTAPGGVTATASDGTASVSWQRPANDGGSPITEYTMTASPGGATVTVDAPSLQANVTELTNGTAYTFTVAARNAVGVSVPSAPSEPVTPRGSAEKPSPPTGVNATPQDGAAVVAWQKPPEGSSPITSYTVLASPGGATATVQAPQLEATVTGLANGTAYTFTVTATNVAGTSDPSEPSEAVVAGRAPQPPTNVIASASDGTATVNWTPPLDPGTSPITGYTILETGTRETVTVHGQETATFEDLTNGASYSFQVKATNATGTSKYSTSSSPVIPRKPKPPGQPFITTTHGRDGEVKLSWSPPPTGAAGVSRYRIRTEPGGRTQETASEVTTAVVKNLTNGTGYTFTVTAINGNGDGQPSIPARVTPKPGKAPLGPTLLETTAGDGRIDLRWLPTRDGGSPITAYQVTAEPGGASVTVGGNATTAALTGLANGTAYTVELTAVNGTGTSGAAVREGITPTAQRPPRPPGNVTAAATGDGEAQVTWSPPTDIGSAPIQQYTVTAAPGGRTASTTSCGTGQRTCTVTVDGLDPTVEYTFTVTAASADGTSDASPATLPITSKLTMRNEPWELTPAAAQALTKAGDDGTLVFADAPQEVVDLTAGQYLVVPQSSAAPNGLIRKVTQVHKAGTAVTLSTMPAAIEDLIDEGDFSGALTLGAADLAGGPPGSQQRTSTRSDGFSPDPISVSFSRDIGQNGRIDADLTLTPKLTYDARLRDRKLTGQVSVTANLAGHIRLHTDRKETWTRQFPLGKWTFRKMVGIGRFKVPLTFTTILAAKVHADASGAVTLDGRHNIDAGMTAEIDGKRASFTPTFTNRTTVGQPELDGSASARVDVIGKHFVSFADTLGVGVEASPNLALDADVNADPWWKVSAGAVVRGCVAWSSECTPLEASKEFSVVLRTADGPFRGISIKPARTRTESGEPVDFDVVTHNASEGPVTWSVVDGPGSIDDQGVYVSDTEGTAVVRAVRQGGVDDPDAEAVVVVGPGQPGTPINVTAEPGPLSVLVSWQPDPDTLVGIERYAIHAVPLNPAEAYETIGYTLAADRSYRLPELKAGVAYAVQVIAISTDGYGPPSASVIVTPTAGIEPIGDAINMAVDAAGNPDKTNYAGAHDIYTGGGGIGVSGDGGYVFFTTIASSNLVPAGARDPSSSALYLLRKDTVTGQIDLASRAADGVTPQPLGSPTFFVSRDGSQAAFISTPDGAYAGDVLVHDLSSQQTWTAFASTESSFPLTLNGLSSDGETVLVNTWHPSSSVLSGLRNGQLVNRDGTTHLIYQCGQEYDMGAGRCYSDDRYDYPYHSTMHMATNGETVTWVTEQLSSSEPEAQFTQHLKTYDLASENTAIQLTVDYSASNYMRLSRPSVSGDGLTIGYTLEYLPLDASRTVAEAYVKKISAGFGELGHLAGWGEIASMSADGRFVGTSKRSTGDTESFNRIYDVDADGRIPVKGLGVSLSSDATAGVSSEKCPPDGCTNAVWYQTYKVPGRHGSMANCNDPDYGYVGQHGRRTGIRVKLCKGVENGGPPDPGIKPPGWPISQPGPDLNLPRLWPKVNYIRPNSNGRPVWVFQRGHLLGSLLGGSGSVESNLIAQFGNSNNLLQRPTEIRVKEALEAGGDGRIYYYVTPVYSDNIGDDTAPLPEFIGPDGWPGPLPSIEYPMPNKVHMVARGGNGFLLDACIINTHNEGAVVIYNDPCIA